MIDFNPDKKTATVCSVLYHDNPCQQLKDLSSFLGIAPRS